MFEQLQALPDDPILNLARLCREDKRAGKIDVGVGIYQNERGETPVMRAVKAAEHLLWQNQDSKKYLGLSGNEAFNQELATLVLGDSFSERVRVNQTIAGTGALSLIAAMLADTMPDATVHVPTPTWGNHLAIFQRAGFPVKSYPYYNEQTSSLEREAFFQYLQGLGKQDIVLLHGCCHNPTGEDLTPQDWQELTQIAQDRGFLPIIDTAYLGFGAGIDQDAHGLRHMCANLEQVFLAISCSKNFGLYRDRAGAAITVSKTPAIASAVQSHLSGVSRTLISVPADHGAAVVATILADEQLRKDWLDELQEMSAAINQKRRELQTALESVTQGDWSFISRQKGMFSLLPLGVDITQKLREDYAIYMVGTGRINIAGLRDSASSLAIANAIQALRQ